MQIQLQKLRNFVRNNLLYSVSLLFVCCLPFFAGKILADSQAYIFGQYINYLQIRVTLHFLLAIVVLWVNLQYSSNFFKKNTLLLAVFALITTTTTINGFLLGSTINKAFIYAATGLFNSVTWVVTATALVLSVTELLKNVKFSLTTHWLLFGSALFQLFLGIAQLITTHPIFPWFFSKLGQPPEFTSFTYIGTTIFSRAYGTTPHPNFLGMILVLFLFIILSLKIPKLWKTLTSLLFVIGIGFTLSKISLLAAGAVLICFAAQQFIHRINVQNMQLAGLYFLSQVAAIFALPNFVNSDESFLASRGIISTMYLSLLNLHPQLLIWGTGLKFSITSMLANSAALETTIIYINRILAEPPHNALLLLVIEIGIPATVLLGFAGYKLLNDNTQEFHNWQKFALVAILITASAVDHLLVY